MAIRNPQEKLDRALGFLQVPAVKNMWAQAHARAILRHLTPPSPDWPRFRPDLDDRLHHAAHYLLWTALQLLEAGQPAGTVRPLLIPAAEAWEFIAADPRFDSSVRIEQAINATFGYYLAGHYARSFVLLREAVPDTNTLPPILALLVTVFRKQLGEARSLTLALFSQPGFSDEQIVGDLEAGRLSQDEAYQRILLVAATQAVSLMLEFPKGGERHLLDQGISILDDAILIARENRFADWWWWLFCLRFLFQEFGAASPWTRLQPLRGSDTGAAVVDEYIRAGLRNQPPIIELWPSQCLALPTITDAARKDFCLKMPTSAGKTRIAELTILQFLLDHPTDTRAKCIYLAPFRSLAVEVEQTLRRSLGTLGVAVSQIYGGFEVTPADMVFLERYRVLIATPEKFDALLRFTPEFASDIRLVIIDEGHIIDPNERGLRFEFFVHRLRHRLRRPHCRFVFISAVLPNAAQFAEWITGSPDNLVESDWRPSRLMLGRLAWDGASVRIDYTHEGRTRFDQECFVPRFIEQRPCQGVTGLGRRRKPFPSDADEAHALAALLFAQEGTTLVFVPQKRSVESFGRLLLDTLQVHRCLQRSGGEAFDLPTPGRSSAVWERCRSIIEAELGPDSSLLEFLREGILVHHGDLPWRVRVAIEELARSDAIRLIVATTTIAQGINLPIKTVLVRGLQLGHNQNVSPMTFWNICGRSGRAMKENEGQILFCQDRTAPRAQRNRQEQLIATVLDTLHQARVVSAMLWVLSGIVNEWNRAHPNVGLADLCVYLAENRPDWMSPDEQGRIGVLLDHLDGHLLSLMEELEIDPSNPDRVQDALQHSLLYIQLRDQPRANLSQDAARDIFAARMRYIHRAHPDPAVRKRLYRLGMTLSSCQSIEDGRDQLLSLFREAEGWAAWPLDQRADLLFRISQFIFQIPETSPEEPVPPEWPSILRAWLAGTAAIEMVQDETIKRITTRPSELSVFLDRVCGYLLPWGVNSVLTFLSLLVADSGQSIPTVCSYFAGMVKYGVGDAVAVCIVPYLDQDRKVAIAVAAFCPFAADKPAEVIQWILSVSAEELEQLGMERALAEAVIRRRGWQQHPTGLRGSRRLSSAHIVVTQVVADQVEDGQKIIVVPVGTEENSEFEVFALTGISLGKGILEGPIPDWWKASHLIDAEVEEKRQNVDSHWELLIRLTEL